MEGFLKKDQNDCNFITPRFAKQDATRTSYYKVIVTFTSQEGAELFAKELESRGFAPQIGEE